MGANIELWKYRLFTNNSLYLEEVLHNKNARANVAQVSNKNPVMVEAGKKAAQVRATAVYSVDEHFEYPYFLRDMIGFT